LGERKRAILSKVKRLGVRKNGECWEGELNTVMEGAEKEEKE